MLRLENAQKDVQQYVEKANLVLDKATDKALPQALPDLVYAKELQDNASAVFVKLHIRDLAQPELAQLTTRLQSYHAALNDYTQNVIEKLITKTLTLQSKVLEINSRPLSGSASGSSGMVDFLGDEFNKDIQDCCLEDLSRIAILLHDSPIAQERQMSRLLAQIPSQLNKILADPAYAEELREQVQVLTVDDKLEIPARLD